MTLSGRWLTSSQFKFLFVAGCLVFAIISGRWSWSRKDWAWLVGALFFTLLADYFLVLRVEHLLGVAAFCFAHVCYIFRVLEFRRWLVWAFFGFLAVWAAALFFGSVVVLAGIYACLFGLNIFVNFRAKRPRVNYCLVLVGLILFVLCDLNVMLYNLPKYMGMGGIFKGAYTMIWIFYLPSQALLAASAVRWGFRRSPDD